MQCNAGACKTAQLHFRIHLPRTNERCRFVARAAANGYASVCRPVSHESPNRVVVRNNSRRWHVRVRHLQTWADSGMMGAMLQLARAMVGVASDVLRLVVSFLRSSSTIRAENLVLRRQLASYVERGIKPRRVDHATRVSLALFTRMFDWRTAVINVRPATIVRWHRMGWRIFWRRKCRAGRPPIPHRTAQSHSQDGRREPVMG